jgi:hypothetical protein
MRQSHERLLAAKGILLRKSIPIRALNVFLAEDQTDNSLLVLRGKFLGPSWPIIAEQLEQAGIEHTLVEAGKPWLVVADNHNTRGLLQDSSRRSKECTREQVLVPDVGFVSAGSKKKFEPRVLIGPAVLALISFALALFPASLPEPVEQTAAENEEATCALDLKAVDRENWIASSINLSSSSESGEILVDSNLGLLSLEIEQTIGSTQSVTGSIKCKDGRSESLHYRLDASASGNFVELSQKLDP